MFSFSSNCVCVALIVTFAVIQTRAENEVDLMEKYAHYLLECTKYHPVSSADLEKLKNREMPLSKAAKCLFACAYKKAGIMNEDGELSVERVFETTRLYLNGEYDLQRAKYFAHACQYVNYVNVGTVNKDCERAALIFKCTVEKAAQFNFSR